MHEKVNSFWQTKTTCYFCKINADDYADNYRT